jgi:McbB family protein
VVILCNRYDYHSLKASYFKIANNAANTAIMVAHYMPEHYYVSQPYVPEIGNACHFCQMDRLLYYEENKKSKNNWSQLLRFSHQKNAGIPDRRHTQLQRSLAVGLLTARINLFTSHTSAKRHQDSALSSASINLSTGKIDEEIVPHWTLCQCLRKL